MLITHVALQLEALVLKHPVHFRISLPAALTAWYVDSLRHTTRIPWRVDVTAGARQCPSRLEPWPALHAYPTGSLE